MKQICVGAMIKSSKIVVGILLLADSLDMFLHEA